MEIKNQIIFQKGLDSYEFAPIGEDDVTNHYVKALQDQKSYVQNIHENISLEKQKAYVKKIRLSKDDGIFGLLVNGQLIGTSGVQNIIGPGFTTIGIFVFDKINRKKGYGKTLVWASSYLLSQTLGCSKFSAGMEKTNIASFKTFKACGYDILKEGKYDIFQESKDCFIMKLNAPDLVVPEDISGVRLA
ncbi:MAG: GNAT family N-acetyltransferase [Desulfobacula sp.]|nr:GNAT family N-acetyltransferase [Desulfobacula sp.]MBT6338195.1 GNAT family N-acetyltransferase [Desulfobacula sp.]MBT7260588.1 GNAT family N-acetyltransferase [Desulfobacula sp.]